MYFERIKDEIREGRSLRSAVPRAWVRARRTILSADAVSFLAAAILYLLAIGDVKGFAFTLGMSTVLDLVVVFLFTHPLLAVLSRFRWFGNSRISGLGRVEHTRRPGAVPRRRRATSSVPQTGARHDPRPDRPSDRRVRGTRPTRDADRAEQPPPTSGRSPTPGLPAGGADRARRAAAGGCPGSGTGSTTARPGSTSSATAG